MPRIIAIKVRRDTGANWIVANPVLELGEIGLDTTTAAFKVGDGVTAWNALAYAYALPLTTGTWTTL